MRENKENEDNQENADSKENLARNVTAQTAVGQSDSEQPVSAQPDAEQNASKQTSLGQTTAEQLKSQPLQQQSKSKKTWHDFFLIPILAGFVIILFGGLLEFIIDSFMNDVSKKTGNAYYEMLGMYLSTAGIWVICLSYLVIVKYNNPILKALWTRPKGNNVKMLLFGLLVGFIMNGSCAAAALLHNDIALSFDKFVPLEFFTLLIAVFMQSSAEELLCRGFMYQRLRKGYKNPWVAIILNSLVFAMLHLGNDGMTGLSLTELFLTGLLFGMTVYYFDSIWFAMAVHCSWNFTQNVLLGLPNSGIESKYSVFKLVDGSAHNSFAYDVSFGVEGTIAAVAVVMLACAIVWFTGRKRKERDLDVWAEKRIEA